MLYYVIHIYKEEEAVWTDYSKDEVVVKDQMTDTLINTLIQDTTDVFSSIYRKHLRDQAQS